MPLINTADAQYDANDGRIVPNPQRMGNRRWGTKVFLSGTEQPIATEELAVEWNDYESITVSTTALALTAIRREGKTEAQITVETASVRYRIDGQSPTASVGHQLDAGDVLTLRGTWEIEKFRVIRKDASDATLRVSYGVRRDQ